MNDPTWLKRIWVDAVHFQQMQRSGGRYGVLDEGIIEAALARPRNQWAYNRETDLATLAADYAYGLTRGHGYGGKISLWLAMIAIICWHCSSEGGPVGTGGLRGSSSGQPISRKKSSLTTDGAACVPLQVAPAQISDQHLAGDSMRKQTARAHLDEGQPTQPREEITVSALEPALCYS